MPKFFVKPKEKARPVQLFRDVIYLYCFRFWLCRMLIANCDIGKISCKDENRMSKPIVLEQQQQ